MTSKMLTLYGKGTIETDEDIEHFCLGEWVVGQ